MNSEEIKQGKEKKSFWDTTIGIITKIAALLTAVTALIIAFRNFSNTVHSNSDGPSSTTTPSTSSSSVDEKDTIILPVDSESNKATPIEKKPDIRISAFSISPSEITLDEDAKPKTFTATLEAFNRGNALAENCIFRLESDGGVIGNATSESFSLDPSAKKQVVINANISNSGKVTAKLSCSNDTEKSSLPVYITVYNYGTVHHIYPKVQ